MQLAFQTQALRTLCEDAEAAELSLGRSVARELRTRLADLRAVTVIAKLPAGNTTRRGEGAHEAMLIHLGCDASLELVPNHQAQRLTADGEVEWNRVSRLKVVRIGTLDD